MTDYTQSIDFSNKDALSSGDPNKIIKGADLDTELALISTAIASKGDDSAKQDDVITTRGDLVRGSSAGAAERLALGTNGQFLRSDGTDAAWETVSVPTLVQETLVTTTSGTDATFNASWPTNVKRITMQISGFSQDTASQTLLVQLSTSSAFVTTGYAGTATVIATGYSSAAWGGTGCELSTLSAAGILDGLLTVEQIDSSANDWVFNFTGTQGTTQAAFSFGNIALAGTVDGIRLVLSGAGTFDAGKINVLYETPS